MNDRTNEPAETLEPGAIGSLLPMAPVSFSMGFIVALAILFMGWQFKQNVALRHLERVRADVVRDLATFRAEAEIAMNKRIHCTVALQAFVTVRPDMDETEFSSIAKVLRDEVDGIRSVTSIKNNIINFVYPRAGNEAALGLDLSKHAKQRADIEVIKRTKKPLLSGPLDLKQGGQAFACRAPVFTPSEDAPAGVGHYWGLVSILIDTDTVAKDLQAFHPEGLSIAIVNDPVGEKEICFYGDIDQIQQLDPMETNISFPSGRWRLFFVPKGGWPTSAPNEDLFQAIAVATSLFAGLLIASLVQTVIRYREYAARLRHANAMEQAAHQKAENAIRKAAERTNQLQRYAEQLEEAQVASLNIMEDIEIARNEAMAANEAKSQFLANMSHEIRTPLNSVIVLTEIVARSDLPPTQRDHLRTVLDSAESLLTVINDILDFSKIEAGKLDLQHGSFNLRDTIGDAMHGLAPRAHAQRNKLTCFVSPDVPHRLCGDSGRLRQVLVNLVGNATKFTEGGEIRVCVEVADTATPFHMIRFTVEDSGIGIAEKNLNRIFDSFRQADGSTTRRFGGTGLGLTICRQLVELMGGEIGVESKLGVGSKFYFTALLESDAQSQLGQDEELSGEVLSGSHVLIVDEDGPSREILRAYLDELHMHAHFVSSFDEAFEYLEQHSPGDRPVQLVLCDYDGRDEGCTEFIQRVRQQSALKSVPVLLATVAGFEPPVAWSNAQGVSGCIMKPVKQSDLLQRFMGLLGDEPSSISLPQSGDDALLPHLRILIVDDSAVNRKVALLVLGEDQHTMMVAQNGRDAVALLQTESFDLVLMDVEMPEMDGLTATRTIREMEQGTERRTPIVAMTANALHGDREKCIEAGMDQYVSKPIRRNELIAAISQVIDNEDAGKTAPMDFTDDSQPEIPMEPDDPPQPGESMIDQPELLIEGAISTNLVDWDVLIDKFGGDRSTVYDVVEISVSELNQLQSALPAKIEEQDWREVRRLAHTIKGIMKHFSVEPAIAAALALESLAGSEEANPAAAQNLLQEMNDAVSPVNTELSEYLSSERVTE